MEGVEEKGASFLFFPSLFSLKREPDRATPLPRARTSSNALILAATPAHRRLVTGTRKGGRAKRANREGARDAVRLCSFCPLSIKQQTAAPGAKFAPRGSSISWREKCNWSKPGLRLSARCSRRRALPFARWRAPQLVTYRVARAAAILLLASGRDGGGGKEGVDRLRQKRKRVRERIAKRKERTNKKKTDFFFSDLDLDGECSFLRSSLLFFPSLVPPPVAGTLAGSAGEKGRKTRATTSSQQQPWKSFQQCVRAREKSLKNFPPVCARKTDERKETSKTLRHASPFFPLSFPLCFCLFTS